MIQQPRRSVTRFFVPLIDVLILLFCIFLLMPYVRPSETESGDTVAVASAPDPAPMDLAVLKRELENSQTERNRLQQRLDEVLKRLAIRVLEIDPNTGRLYYYDPDRKEIANEADAQLLIERERHRATGRSLYFLFLMPRGDVRYPLRQQEEAYQYWFRNVPSGFDGPQARE